MNDQLMAIYIEEVREHLEVLDSSLMKLENNPGDKDLLNKIFRVAHTIKGSSAAMNFFKMEKLTHGMEDILADIRDEKLEADKKIIELMFICHDFLENSLDSIIETGNEEDIKSEGLLEKLHLVVEEKINSKNQLTEDKKTSGSELILSKDECEKTIQYSQEAYNIFTLKLILEENSPLNSVTAWMIYDLLNKHCIIIKSEPEKITKEEFENKDYQFRGSSINAVVATRVEKNELFDALNSIIATIESIAIENYEAQNIGYSNFPIRLITAKEKAFFDEFPSEPLADSTVNEIIGGSPQEHITIDELYRQDCIVAINEQMDKTEMSITTFETEPWNDVILNSLFRSFHTVAGLANFIDLSYIGELASGTEKLIDYFRSKNIKPDESTRDLMAVSIKYIKTICINYGFLKDEALIYNIEKHLKALEADMAVNPNKQKLGSILVSEGKLSNEDVGEILNIQKEKYPNLKFGQVAIKENKAELKDVIDSLRIQKEEPEKPKASINTDSGFMRIPTQKVDTLIDMLGELLIVHSLLEMEIIESGKFAEMNMNSLSRMAKIIKNVQGLSLSLRMVSLKPTFQKLQRIARDTALELNKNIRLEVTGDETETDRSVADKIFDPLMHLVRNAISHGIENEEERAAAGKNPQGVVSLSAYSKSGNIYIEVGDDGKGLSTEKIFNKAKEKGLIDTSRSYSDSEILKFIFLPGFSTQEVINNISGRGVGMNVVETEISKIGGKVDIINNLGKGCKFVLKIPINLAVMNGTVVNIFGTKYIVPTACIKEFLKPQTDQWVSVKGNKSMIRVRNEIFELIPIKEIFSACEFTNKDEEMIIILELEQKTMALPVREVLGRQEVVAKSLGEEFKALKFASGATILGDGKVSLILDVDTLFKAQGS